MPGPKPRLHLPFADWPKVDKQVWASAVANDDPFDDGPGARLAKSTLHKYWMGWRRFLGFLMVAEPDVLDVRPLERLTKSGFAALPNIWRKRIRRIRSRSRWTAFTAPLGP